jgi:WD40 repeat protein
LDNTVKLWDVTSRALLHNLEGHSWGVTSVSFSPDGTKVASGSWDNTVKLWDVTSGALLHNLVGHSYRVDSVSFSPDGTKVASGSYDKTVKLWDVTSGVELRSLEGHSYGVSSVSFSPDGTKVASGSVDRTVKLWDVTSGVELRSLEGHSHFVNSVSFSRDGTKVASGSDDNTVKVWDVTSGECLQTLEGHSRVNCVSFSRDGTKVASGSEDKTVKLWDVTSGECLQTLRHRWDVRSVSFQKNNLLIAVRNKLYTYYSLEYEKELIEATNTFIVYKHKNVPYDTIPSQYPLAFKKGLIALQVPTVRGFIVAMLNPELAKHVRRQLGLPPMFPMAFYEDKIIFFIEGKIKAATFDQITTPTDNDGSVVKRIRELIRIFGGLNGLQTSNATYTADDGANELIDELKLLRLRF